MKSKSSSPKATLAAAALLCLSSADGWARAPRARELCGVVQAIDQQTHCLTIQSLKRDQPLAVVWRRNTRFIKNWKFVPADTLEEGTRGCVCYHTPFFGNPFVTKVVWVNERSAQNQSLANQ